MSSTTNIWIVLHPHYKMDYFKQAKWKVDWINTAHDLIHTTYDLSYAPHHIQDDAESIPDPNTCKEEVSPFPSISMTVTS